jgi:hypothetical protein
MSRWEPPPNKRLQPLVLCEREALRLKRNV